MLVDTITIHVKAGSGGDGAATFLRNAMTAKGGPDGGNGGNGGSVYFKGSHNLSDLKEFRYKKEIVGLDGVAGQNKKMHGKNAEDITVYLPIGTTATDLTTGDVFEILDENSEILIARGGKGGRGNTEFKSATNQRPKFAEEGTPGQERELLLELKFIAQVGLIGLPNAGKSTLLTMLTHATPKIGAYPFTTLEPSIGMMGEYAIADIPGLIEGASAGKGLGTQFLKHIEKTEVFIHCIDATESDVVKAYTIVRKEFEKHNPELIKKPEIILLTKSDLAGEKKVKEATALLKKHNKTILSYSQYDPKSIDDLKEKLQKFLQKAIPEKS